MDEQLKTRANLIITFSSIFIHWLIHYLVQTTKMEVGRMKLKIPVETIDQT